MRTAPVMAVVRRRPKRSFMHVQFAQDHHPGVAKSAGHWCVGARDPPGCEPVRGRQTGNVDVVLDGNRHSVQARAGIAFGPSPIALPGLLTGEIAGHVNEGVERPAALACDPFKKGEYKLERGQFAGGQCRRPRHAHRDRPGRSSLVDQPDGLLTRVDFAQPGGIAGCHKLDDYRNTKSLAKHLAHPPAECV